MSKEEKPKIYWCESCQTKFKEPAKKQELIQWGTLDKDGKRITFHADVLLCCPSCYSQKLSIIVSEGKKFE